MSESRMFVPQPPALNPARLSDPALTIRGRGPNGPVLVHFDPEQNAGGVCHLAGEVWALYGPLPFQEFVASLGQRGVVISDGDDLARWVNACSSIPGGTAH